jgi:hypothetical protein
VRPGRWRLTLAAAGILALTACGGDAEPDSAPDAGPPDTGVTFPNQVTVPTSVADGTASTTTTGAESDIDVSTGAPRGFPTDFPRPDEADVVVGSATIVGEDRVLSLDLTTSRGLDEVVAFFRDAVGEADFAVLFDELDEQGRPPSADLRFETEEYVGDVFMTSTDLGTSIVLTATMPAG